MGPQRFRKATDAWARIALVLTLAAFTAQSFVTQAHASACSRRNGVRGVASSPG
ncbi:MAG TPA: hypothetical protein VII49_02340 [Rhizomicrobium sp.]